ncbi:MAG: GGDEF domain-containing protein [Chromatiales bacterium]|nr:GGDEF domain-containing protein [Chromatiales bacterium]
MQIANDNKDIFEHIASGFKDAVSAEEKQWLKENEVLKEQLRLNLNSLRRYSRLIDTERLEILQETFDRYYKVSNDLSLSFIDDIGTSEHRNILIEQSSNHHTLVARLLIEFEDDIQNQFSSRINDSIEKMEKLLMLGVFMLIFLLMIVMALTFFMSLSTRRRLRDLIVPLKDMASEKPDFSFRLTHNLNDELGELTHWFNVLTRKMEKDYKKIEMLSNTDKLTQLYNRTMLDSILEGAVSNAIRYNQAFSIILMDLDKFKLVNDTYGHIVGDSVLQKMAEILRQHVRSSDSVGRWGGEEFLVILPNTTKDGAVKLAEKLRKIFAEYKFEKVGQKTVSFGVASYRPGDDADSFLTRADKCLYHAKAAGRNCVTDEDALVE